jgi:serpin B
MKLIKNLEKLGVMDVFSPGKADLSGISGNFLYVSDAIHKAFIEVTEDGTEAAAATGAGISARSSPMQANFNRPFVFLIKDEETGLILFQGRVSHPLQS